MASIKKAPTWVVAPGKSMKIRDKVSGKAVILGENTVLHSGQLGDDECKMHEQAGFLVRKGYEDEAVPEVVPQIKQDGELGEAPPPPPPTKADKSIWNVDPKKLKGKKLDALNVMIAERDPNHPPAASEAEAIKVLSADHQG